MKRILTFAALVVFVCFVMVSFSGPALAGHAKTAIIVGTLQEVDGQYTIKTKKGTFAVTGQDFSELVGQEVKATGKVTSGPNGDVLNVSSIKKVGKKMKRGSE
jgi:hypothetical protein